MTISEPREGRWRAGGDRGGFILPLAVFILLVLIMLAMSAFFISNQESLMATATRNAELAFYVSERGGVEVLSGWDGDTYGALNAFDTTSYTDTLAEGTFTVKVTRMTGNMFLLDSESYITSGGPMRAGARRRLGYVVRTLAPNITLPSAGLMTRASSTGATTVGASVVITGADDPPTSLTSVCAVTSATEEGIISNDTASVILSATTSALGDPAKYQSGSLDTTSFTDFGGLSWTDLTAMATHTLAGGSLSPAPDTTGGRCVGTTTSNWGNTDGPTSGCGLYYPIIYVTGSVRLSFGSGQGILLVEDDLNITGNFEFHGLIVVQGRLDTSGTNTIHGAVMAKNEDNTSQSIRGTTLINYSRCALNRAVAFSTGGNGYPINSRGWVDLSGAAY